MARANLNTIRGSNAQTDFQKTYYWNLQMINAPAGGYFPLSASPRLDMLCTSTEIPHYEGETATQMIKGYAVLDPGIYKPVGKMTLTFVEMIDSQIRSGWDSWMAACRNKQDLFSNLYGDFMLTTTNNQGGISYQYNMLWCFPDATEPGELDSENSNPMSFKVTLRYTDVRIGSKWVTLDTLGTNAPG